MFVPHEICNENRYHIEARIILLTKLNSRTDLAKLTWPISKYGNPSLVNVSNVKTGKMRLRY